MSLEHEFTLREERIAILIIGFFLGTVMSNTKLFSYFLGFGSGLLVVFRYTNLVDDITEMAPVVMKNLKELL